MFSVYHLIWGVICIAIITTCIILINKYKPDFKRIETIACIVCVASEFIKIFSLVKMVPGSDGNYHPYLQLNQLPFHLCSIQIVFIFICRLSKNEKLKRTLYAFMYPTCIIGAIFALVLPSIFSTTIDVTEAFTAPIAYQTFLYHSMLIIYGYSIIKYKMDEFNKTDYFKTIGILSCLSFASIYLNSIFASPVYEEGALKYVEFTTNFFFTYETPIGLELTKIWQWYVYILILVILGVTLIAAAYIPIFIKNRKAKTNKQ